MVRILVRINICCLLPFKYYSFNYIFPKLAYIIYFQMNVIKSQLDIKVEKGESLNNNFT